MTTLNCTITPERAYISQDRGCYDYGVEGMPPESVKQADAPATSKRLSDVQKISVFDDKRLAIGCSGSWTLACSVHAWAEQHVQSIDAVAITGAELFRGLIQHAESHAHIPELVVIAAGYSPMHGRVIGYAFDFRDDFKPIALEGTTQLPACDPAAPNYRELYDEFAAVRTGEGDPVTLHAGLQANQRWQCEQGLLRAGVVVSDGYDLASVDHAGARISPEAERMAA